MHVLTIDIGTGRATTLCCCAGEGAGPIVVAGECAVSTKAPRFDQPTLRTMCRGAELVQIGARRLRLDEDTYMVANGDANRSSAYAEGARVRPLLVAFRADAMGEPTPDLEQGGAPAVGAPFAFAETLHPRTRAIDHHLAQIEAALQSGLADSMWWDERLLHLLAAALEVEQRLQGRAGTMSSAKPATRRELLRRVLLATDYIQSHYEQPITLDDIAAAARLSRFHLVRQFAKVLGLTPYDYLTRKRVAVALRLLSRTQLGLDEIAGQAGFGTRSSLFRQLRTRQGRSASALRGLPMPTEEATPCSTFA